MLLDIQKRINAVNSLYVYIYIYIYICVSLSLSLSLYIYIYRNGPVAIAKGVALPTSPHAVGGHGVGGWGH